MKKLCYYNSVNHNTIQLLEPNIRELLDRLSLTSYNDNDTLEVESDTDYYGIDIVIYKPNGSSVWTCGYMNPGVISFESEEDLENYLSSVGCIPTLIFNSKEKREKIMTKVGAINFDYFLRLDRNDGGVLSRAEDDEYIFVDL